ncbi:MAG TPA: hypothetical protein VGQ16_07170 [Vicinamibacterales bacterium]|jgi:hypothetical protein|nr:hypothetical protein [Vicinamibacterales bacterium]
MTTPLTCLAPRFELDDDPDDEPEDDDDFDEDEDDGDDEDEEDEDVETWQVSEIRAAAKGQTFLDFGY